MACDGTRRHIAPQSITGYGEHRKFFFSRVGDNRHHVNNCLQATYQFWHFKWCVGSSVNVMMTTSVSGLTAQRRNSLQLKWTVNNDTILSYRASLTATSSPSWQSFAMNQGTCSSAVAFGSMLMQLVLTTFTWLTALHSQVGLCDSRMFTVIMLCVTQYPLRC